MTSKRNAEIKTAPTPENELIRNSLWGLIKGISAQRTFAEMLVHAEGMEESEAPSLEDVAHMVAGMAERLDLHLNHVKQFVFDQVGSS